MSASIAKAAKAAISTFARIKRAFATGPEVFHHSSKTILVPVRDDAFAPALNCGEFAVVDITDPTPEHKGLFYLLDHEHGGYQAIVQLLDYNKRTNKTERIIPDDEDPGPFWERIMGCNTLFDPATKQPLKNVVWSDGHASERYLARQIVGRVIGVLGHENRPVTWEGTV